MNRNELIFKINIEKQKIIERKLQDGTFDNPYAEELYKKLHEKKCPSCGSLDIGIDNWGMFEGKQDWYYYCKKCDDIF